MPILQTDGDANDSRGFGAPGVARLAAPILLSVLLIGPLFVVGRNHGWIANVPIWVLVGSLLFSQVATMAAAKVWPNPRNHAELWARVFVMQATIAICIYATGWGATLALGFVFGAAETVRVVGSRAARPAAVVTVAVIGIGELFVASGAVPSMLQQPQGHGLALLEAIGAASLIALLGLATLGKERVEDSVRHSEARFRALVQHSSDVFMVIDLEGRVSYLSPSITRLLGYDADDVTRITRDFIDEPDLQRARAFLAAAATRAEGEATWMELRVRHANGGVRWFEVGVTNRLDDPSVKGLVCNMRDVTERKGIEAELEHRAHHDQLTGLPNRVSFLTRLDAAIEDAHETGASVGVLFVDVDRFKEINDSLGHEAGDRLLFDLAHRLRASIRPQDLVARYGGDEFTVLLEDLESVGAATAVADRIADALSEPLIFEGHEIALTASVGIAVSTGGDASSAELLRHADLAMYVVKDTGRSGWELFDSPVDPQEPDRRDLADDLWEAIDSNQLLVRFQPEFALATGDVVAAEALVRWPHPTRGLLEPDDFLPLAKETNLIVAVDRYVLREACRCAKQWWEVRNPRERVVVSVNLSPRFIRQPDVVDDIVSTLREVGADPRGLQIEITERTALTDLDQTVDTLDALRRLGIRVAIDDFGTGYSSLSYLKRLPVDVVKLDRSFVESMDQLESDVAIVQAVITMSHALGMKVTAEGVERVEQAARLRRLGCDTAMGFYWTSAVAADAMLEILREGVVREDLPVVALARAAAGGAS